MAKYVAVSVRDQAVGRYNRPWFVPTLNVGIRAFSDAVNSTAADNGFRNHPNDYALFEMGTFDDETGVLEPLKDGPRQVALAREFLVSQ